MAGDSCLDASQSVPEGVIVRAGGRRGGTRFHQADGHGRRRVEHLLFDGAADAEDGVLRPELSRPGLGLELKNRDADRYRV